MKSLYLLVEEALAKKYRHDDRKSPLIVEDIIVLMLIILEITRLIVYRLLKSLLFFTKKSNLTKFDIIFIGANGVDIYNFFYFITIWI